MSIWERLGNVIKSYLNDEDKRNIDPDLDAAYEELDDFLNGKETCNGKEHSRPLPRELYRDFAELGLTPQASARECRDAYKKLLKIHHPDRHTKHQGNLKKATEKTARINAAYGRLKKWFGLTD